MSILQTSGLTEKAADGLAYLERDRWPEFERELCKRRSIHFDIHHYGAERQNWEWLVPRCRTWAEVSWVLNHYQADWKKQSRQILLEGIAIYKLR